MIVKTYALTIYVGLREGYDGPTHSPEEAESICQEYVDVVGLCVTVTPTTFVYKRGKEPGVAVGLIQYPRFPASEADIWGHANELATRLQYAFKQNRVSIVGPEETVMLGAA